MTAFARLLLALPLMLVLTCSAQAHPHMFFSSTAQFILDDQGRLTSVRVVFLVDELNTMFTLSELGVNKDGDNELSGDESNKVARNILEGFGHYRYFTYLHSQTEAIALGKPPNMVVQLEQGRLGLSFTLPLEKPLVLNGQSLSLQLYDPTYFTAITTSLPPTVIGSGPVCTISVRKPSDTKQTRKKQVLLSRLSREEKPDIENVGEMFAETTRLTCQG